MDNNVRQVIKKDGKVMCVTTIPYPKSMVQQMKKAGYKVLEVNNDKA